MAEKERGCDSSGLTGSDPRGKRRRPLWLRMLKWLGVTAAVVVGLFVAVCSLIVWILTPDRLTPLVERQASKYLLADVSLGRVELTFWKSFPKMTVDVDSMVIVSRSLGALPDSVLSQLPGDADSLLSLRSFHGGINVSKLALGELALYDVAFRSLKANLLQVNDSVANYLIVPESADTVPPSTPLVIPKFSINRFSVSDAGPIRFRSLPDSLDVALSLHAIDFAGHSMPHYRLGIEGGLKTGMLGEFGLESLDFGAQGGIKWDRSDPFSIAFSDFVVEVDDLDVTFDADVDFRNSLILESFAASTGVLPVGELLQHLPRNMMPLVEPLKTDMGFKAGLTLTSRWDMADSLPPSFDATIEIPACAVDYQNLHFKKFEFGADVHFDGSDMDKSVFDIRHLLIDGRTIDIDLRAKISSPVSDPRVEGRFKGAVNLDNFPPRLRERLPVAIGGIVDGNAGFRFRLSDLDKGNFHRLYAEGELDMRNLMVDAPGIGNLFARHAVVDFGSNSVFVNDSSQKIDSLLTLSVKIDTISANAEGMQLEARGIKAGAGTVNRRSSADTTEINPFGMNFAIERLKLDSPADTLRLRLRDASIGGSLRRYKGEAKLPQLNLKMGLGALVFGQSLTRFSLRQADVVLDLHMRQRRNSTLTPEQRAARRKAIADSLAMAAPDAPGGMLSVDIDSGRRRMLRRWDFNGHIKAKSGRVVTPYFPLRNRISNIDLHFSQDSIQLHNLSYKAGQSDFLVNGTISNLRRALIGRRNNTLGVSLTMVSDTINVNEIVRALFAGGSVAQQADSAMIWGDDVDTMSPEITDMADTVQSAPLLVPRNLDARFRMKADNVLYSDLVLHSFKGNLLVYDGAVNLRNLAASTDIGSIRLDGLYAAPSVDELRFGLGMKVSRFRLDRLTAIVPAIDSLLPVMKGFEGIVNADVAVTTDIAPDMDIEIPSLRAAIKIDGDSLVLLDADTFKMLSKWLFFKNKKRNMIDHMDVEVVVENSAIEIFPFMFDIDRYRLGVMGYNDLAMNLDYHVSVLKSPMPFKFGINIKGTPDDMKIRLGGAKFKENMVVERQAIADNTRINIVKQIDNVFRRGISKARMGRLTFAPGKDGAEQQTKRVLKDFDKESLSHADSLQFIRQGLIENPDTLRFPHAAVDSVNLAPQITAGSK